MAGSPLLALPSLLVASLIGLALASLSPQCVTPPDQGSTLQVLHAFGPCSPLRPAERYKSWVDMVLDLVDQDASRVRYLASLAAARSSWVPVAPGRQLLQIPNYVVRARLGSPPQELLVALDTSSDAAWFPCAACAGCPSVSTSFAPTRSASFKPLPCGSPQCSQVPNPSCPLGSTSCAFNLTYGSSSLQAALSQDSLSLAANVIPTFTFGCLQKVTGAAAAVPPGGLLGLGRGPLSFLSQTASRYSSTFSYCLPSFKSLNFSGTLRLGPAGQPKRIKTTPLLSNPHRSSFYYVKMTGIRVGRTVVPIPPSALTFDPSTGGGTILDSGTMFTRLVAPAYAAVRDEFRRRVKGTVTSLGGFDTCYNGPVVAPAITLMFEGMNVTLPEENVMIHSTAGSVSCLAMAAAPDNVNSVLNVIANMQQMNHRVLFDLPNGRVGIARERCTT